MQVPVPNVCDPQSQTARFQGWPGDGKQMQPPEQQGSESAAIPTSDPDHQSRHFPSTHNPFRLFSEGSRPTQPLDTTITSSCPCGKRV